MGQIKVENIRVYGYHGCMEEEARCGQEFIVNVLLDVDLSKASNTDDLNDTVDYVVVHEIVKQQALQRSKLIEHVAHRIGAALRARYDMIERCRVELIKPNPPIGGDVGSVAVVVEV
ncbi:MAG: dihydroneopterin aldolase [Cryomorphaceae bacterium]|nr:dihydroneopterin aldolase [Cryomorphaceae bacterium]